MRNCNLYALKISVSENIFSQKLSYLKKFFKKAIRDSDEYIEEYDSVWGFIDTMEIKKNRRTLLSGTLLRGKDQIKKLVDTDKKSLKKGLVPNVAHEAHFIFDYQTEIVIFEEKKGIISRYQFERIFKEIILTHEPDLGHLVSDFLPAPNLLKEIDKFEKIKYAKFKLHPANWNFDDNFDELDMNIKELKANKVTQTYESEEGLDKKSKMFKDPVNMSLAGYGQFDMNGKDNTGNYKVLKSYEELLSEIIKLEDDVIEEFIEKSYVFLLLAIDQHRRSQNEN